MLITCIKRVLFLCCLIGCVGFETIAAKAGEPIFGKNSQGYEKTVSATEFGESFFGKNYSVYSGNNNSGDKIIFPGIDSLNLSDIPVGEGALVLFFLVVYFNLFYQRKKTSANEPMNTSRKCYYD